MDCFWAEVAEGELVLKEALDAKWLTKETLRSVKWLPADLTLIDKIEADMELFIKRTLETDRLFLRRWEDSDAED